MSQESGFSVCLSEKPKSTVSAILVTVEFKHLPRIQVARQVPTASSALLGSRTAPSALSFYPFLSLHGYCFYTIAHMVVSPHDCLFLITPGCMVESWLPAGMASTLHTSPHGWSLITNCIAACCILSQTLWPNPVLSELALIFKCWPGTSYVTSYPAPPTMCYFCQFPRIFYLLSAAIFSQGRSSQWCFDMPLPWLHQESLNALRVTYSFCPEQQQSYQLAICYAKYLKPYHPLPVPPIQVCGKYSLLFWGTPALHPVTIQYYVIYSVAHIVPSLGAFSGWLLCPFALPPFFCFLNTSLLSGTTRGSGLILSFLFPSLRISHFFKDLWFFFIWEQLLETKIWMLDHCSLLLGSKPMF